MSDLNERFSTYNLQDVGDSLPYTQLPYISGTWYHVNPNTVRHYQTNPYPGDNSNDGLTALTPLASIVNAYAKCYSGRGDGIALHSNGTTSANTTSYLSAAISWSKYNITVFGVAAPSSYYGRARIASASAATTLANLIDVSGQNNRFINVHMANYGSGAAALGCLKVSGNRNAFIGCHFQGAGHATPAAIAHAAGSSYGANDVAIAASEIAFYGCTFGSNSIIRAGNNANIVLVSALSKVKFIGCDIFSYSATAGKGAIALYAAAALNGWVKFIDCTFTNWNPGAVTAHTSVVIGATPNNCGILIQNCGMIGWALWDSATGNDKVYITHAAGHATGGLGIVAS